MSHGRSESPISINATSIGQLLRAQFAINATNHTNDEKPKTVGFNEAENMRLYELYSAKRDEYHSTRPSGQRNEEVPMDTLAREWAAEITAMGFAERTPAQIKQRIRDMRKFSRKHAHKLGLEAQAAANACSPLNEYSWAETKRRSRGPVPDWMTGLAQIMMQEQEKNVEENDSASDAMEAAFGSKAKRCETRNLKQLPYLFARLKEMKIEKASRDSREMSPETALLDKKLQLADAKIESERLRQKALRLEIAYYQRQVQLYDEQIINAAEMVNNSTTELLGFKLNGNGPPVKSETMDS
ncbi:unnamed protein product [Caenorhabditis bovis]|uniref:Uncharacterized protein n=1 Tax=Caenorhabditis bovis TaxID=2654633 RepID=A0A8S1EY19_9PELO|nr:unnamed protein product [Caenorhabditis bovis]